MHRSHTTACAPLEVLPAKLRDGTVELLSMHGLSRYTSACMICDPLVHDTFQDSAGPVAPVELLRKCPRDKIELGQSYDI